MPKLLSQDEATAIAAKMTAEYGLAPPKIEPTNYSGSYDSSLKVRLGRNIERRVYDWFPWYKKNVLICIKEFYADNLEDMLTKLEYELSKFNERTSVAEHYREKFALQEADAVLDTILQRHIDTASSPTSFTKDP